MNIDYFYLTLNNITRLILGKRPKIKIELHYSDRLIELLCGIFVIVLWVFVIWIYIKLPEIIPVHYNESGNPDSYGNKLSIFILPLITSVIYILLTQLNKYPHILYYSEEITKKNALQQYTLATRIIRYVKFTVSLLFLLIVITAMDEDIVESDGLGVWFAPVILIIVFVPLIIFILISIRKRKL